MTREEAIEYIKRADVTVGREIKTKTAKALEMAIKALEQESTTKNDLGVDCVARQDIERYIEGFINEYTPKEELEFINLELDGLKHLPSVTPQEPILDKIRAEIEDIDAPNYDFEGFYKCQSEVLQIIDKYKAESEAEYGTVD